MHINSDPSHDFAHVERVCVLAKKLARQCGCNATIVELAALFHDVYDHKYERGDVHMEQVWEDVGREHQEAVMRLVQNIGWTQESRLRGSDQWTDWHQTCLELHCVMDADKLDALGAIGVLRCAAYAGAKNNPLLGASSAHSHFYEKLIRLEEYMLTSGGRSMARQRTQFMHLFLQQIEREKEESGVSLL